MAGTIYTNRNGVVWGLGLSAIVWLRATAIPCTVLHPVCRELDPKIDSDKRFILVIIHMLRPPMSRMRSARPNQAGGFTIGIQSLAEWNLERRSDTERNRSAMGGMSFSFEDNSCVSVCMESRSLSVLLGGLPPPSSALLAVCGSRGWP